MNVDRQDEGSGGAYIKKKPWDNRKYANPERTWCGKVHYKRRRHYFLPVDCTRIAKLLPIPKDYDIKGHIDIMAVFQAACNITRESFMSVGELVQNVGSACANYGIGVTNLLVQMNRDPTFHPSLEDYLRPAADLIVEIASARPEELKKLVAPRLGWVQEEE